MNGHAAEAPGIGSVRTTLAAAGDAAARGEWARVKEGADAVLNTEPRTPEALFLRALAAYMDDSDLSSAVTLAERAFGLDPGVREYAEFLALLFTQVSDLNNGLYYAKMAVAVPSRADVAGWLPPDLPAFSTALGRVEERPLLGRALWNVANGDEASAEHWLRQHIAFEPHSPEGYLALAHLLVGQDRLREVVDILRGARHVLPDDAAIASELGAALTGLGAFDEGQACHRWAARRSDQPAVAARALVDRLQDSERDAAATAAEVREWGRRFGVEDMAGFGPQASPDKSTLTIGYLIGHGGRRAFSQPLADIMARHDPGRYRVVGFGIGPLTAATNLPFQKACETWHDVRDTDPVTLGAIIEAEDVDILVDVSGFVAPELLTALGGRNAPVQVSWMGAPLGTGLPSVDALIGDKVLDPDDAPDLGLAERIVRLEHGSLVVPLPDGDDLPPAVAGDGAPLTFAADATLAELSPRTVECWARILRAIPGAQLLLLDHDFHNQGNTERLLGLFGDFGVAHRVDVVKDTPAGDLFAAADVCLIPPHCVRPEGAVVPLWSGRPVVTMAPPARHARGVASVLLHAGLGERCVAGDADAYVDLAVAWAKDEQARADWRAGVRERLRSSPQFDPALRARDLEAAYDDLWREACRKAGA